MMTQVEIAEGYSEFDLFLDEALDLIEICGVLYAPSEILKKVDPGHYEGLRQAFLEEPILKLVK